MLVNALNVIKELDPKLLLAAIAGIELLLTTLWWRPLFRSGLPVRRYSLPAVLNPSQLLAAVPSVAQQYPSLAVKQTDGELLVRARLRPFRTGTPFLRAVASVSSSTPEAVVHLQWWVLALLATLSAIRYSYSGLAGLSVVLVVAAFLALFVVLDLRQYRGFVASLASSVVPESLPQR